MRSLNRLLGIRRLVVRAIAGNPAVVIKGGVALEKFGVLSDCAEKPI
jgi:hypothetical protein